MFQVCRRRKGFNSLVWKLLGKQSLETCAKALSRNLIGTALAGRADKFQLARPVLSELLSFKHNISIRLFFESKDTTDQISLLGPEMKQGLRALGGYLILKWRKNTHTFSILNYFDLLCCSEQFQGLLDFMRSSHGRLLYTSKYHLASPLRQDIL